MEKITGVLEAGRKEGFFTGAQLAFTEGNKLRVLSVGYTDKSGKIKVNSDTLFDIASVSKSIFSLYALLLKERGLLGDAELGGFSLDEYLSFRLMATQEDWEALRRLIDKEADNLETIKSALLDLPLNRRKDSKYTNMPHILLALYIHKVLKEQSELFPDSFYELLLRPAAVNILDKNLAFAFNKNLISPRRLGAEESASDYVANPNFYKSEIVASIPHDPTARHLSRKGFVSGHAGIFNNAVSIIKIMQHFDRRGIFAAKKSPLGNYFEELHEEAEKRSGLYKHGFYIPNKEFDILRGVQIPYFIKTGTTGCLLAHSRMGSMAFLSNMTHLNEVDEHFRQRRDKFFNSIMRRVSTLQLNAQ